ncbi:uncharacterized protein LOC131326099 [Rhododendron vialii]|uniref:uncharacterized protein LOC131326099 n=1 Tax=Rhododendron vialii TaxID=182163 RepID=UPI00265FFD5B|nr:uncharacterized protein LOC131326099 [Rhododendron vialii]
MDDLPLEKIQISGPTLSSLLHRFSSSPSDVDGLLFGHVTPLPTTTLSDHPSPTSLSPPLVATVTSFFCSSSTSSFYSPSGLLHLPSLRNLVSSTSSSPTSDSLLGWFSARRRTPSRPSMREAHVTSSLSSKIQFSFQVQNSTQTFTLPPCIFLLLTTPFHNPLIHTHEYRAYQFRISDESFEAKTLDVVNIGPAFRGHYGSFCPNSPFPLMDCDPARFNSMAEDRNCEKGGEKNEREEVDLRTVGFDAGRLSRLVGPEAGKYTGELEDLYKQMLAKLEGLARVVEKGSARVMEQENHNMKLRYRVAGLE